MSTATSTVYDGPFAPILLTFVDDALVHLDVAHDGVEIARAEIVQRLGVVPDPDPRPRPGCARTVGRVLRRTTRVFEIPLDWAWSAVHTRGTGGDTAHPLR